MEHFMTNKVFADENFLLVRGIKWLVCRHGVETAPTDREGQAHHPGGSSC